MVTGTRAWGVSVVVGFAASAASAQQVGSIRGVVIDRDFDAPLPLATVTISETGAKVTASEQGNFVFSDLPPGRYTLVFVKDGYARELKSNVIVTAGQLTEVDASLAGDFAEMEEFIVEDLQIGGSSEAGLLRLRFESPALLDSIGSELISRAGASDAAAALRLVSGATVQDGKFAVIRGLPDRYVSSQLNGVRLPSADEDTRAVELDQFPSAIIESVQVSKTFTPDQQGDASGGAVNLILKGIPTETILQFKGQVSYNSQASNRSDFLTYEGGGFSYWGNNDSRDIQPLGENWGGDVGVSRGDSPLDYKWSFDAGGKLDIEDGVKVGGFSSLFYERDSAFYDNGIDNALWVERPGAPMTPQYTQGTPQQGDFRTKLFDVTQGSQEVKWGWLGTAGIETENHLLGATFLYTRASEDKATLNEDTRGKSFFFPGYDVNDLNDPGNAPDQRTAAPFIRAETLEYTERTTQSIIFNGKHTLPLEEFGFEDAVMFQAPEFDWTIANSSANLNQPDKRQFGSIFLPASLNPGFPPFIPPFPIEAEQTQYKPDANFLLGNLQRTFKEINEDSNQVFANLKLPFKQWTESEGYLKFGVFDDRVTRRYDQESFSNFNEPFASFQAPFETFWSAAFPGEDHPITAGPPFIDVDYRGEQNIGATYAMADLPLSSFLNVIGGARFESTEIGIVNIPEEDAVWFPPGSSTGVKLNPGDADVDLKQDDVLPSIGFVVKPLDWVTVRGSYSETIARPVFKELTPIQQQEFLGADVFVGNPDLRLSSLQNYDIRLDLTPFEGGLISGSYFYKDILDPIEYVQRAGGFTYTTPVNYPKGTLSGLEFEIRQDLGAFWEPLRGFSLGGNATFIDSEVILPADEAAIFAGPGIRVPITSRDMTNAPEFLYNLFATIESAETGTQLGLFYTVKGDTLIAGAGESDGFFVPSIYTTEVGTLNFTISQKLGDYFKLTFQAKNLTDPTFEEVYRSEAIGADVIRRSYTSGIDLSIALTAEFTF